MMKKSDIFRETVCIIVPGSAYSRRSKYYRKYQQNIAQEAKRIIETPSCEDELYVKIDYFYGKDEAVDTDNLARNVLDALEGIVYLNDRQVKEAKVYLHEAKTGSVQYQEPFSKQMVDLAVQGSKFLGISVGKTRKLVLSEGGFRKG